MHLWYAGKNTFIKNHSLKTEISAIHIYDSVVVIKKQRRTQPFSSQKGNFTVGYVEGDKIGLFDKIGHFIFKLKTRLRSQIYK